jgi:hypothetical protein
MERLGDGKTRVCVDIMTLARCGLQNGWRIDMIAMITDMMAWDIPRIVIRGYFTLLPFPFFCEHNGGVWCRFSYDSYSMPILSLSFSVDSICIVSI